MPSRFHQPAATACAALGFSLGVSACSAGGDAAAQPVGVGRFGVVYGHDDRVEPTEVSDDVLRRLALERAVALIPRDNLEARDGAFAVDAPSLGEEEDLCDGERFQDQPTAALCSGLLVAPDLVLTAGHCVGLVPCEDMALVVGYAYTSPDSFDPLEGAEVLACGEIVTVGQDEPDAGGSADYAWIRLARPTASGLAPIALGGAEPLRAGAALATFGFPSGVPLKIDTGGRVADPRAGALDYFTATTDSFFGNSGSPVFDAQYRLVGIESRGAPDYELTDEDCRRVSVEPDTARLAAEEATYAYRAFDGLCGIDPSSRPCCERDGSCPQPGATASSCSVRGAVRDSGSSGRSTTGLVGLVGGLVLWLRRRVVRAGRAARRHRSHDSGSRS